MHNKFFYSLKFQITTVLILLLSLFTIAISYTLYTIDEREKENAALNVINRLQLISNYISMQNFNYLQNVPRNQQAYQRDIKLYYKELKGQLDNKNDIINCFADENLPSDLIGMKHDLKLNLNEKTKNTLEQLQQAWNDYYRSLQQTLGDSDDMPKLEEAANYIVNNQQNIKQIEDVVVNQLQEHLKHRINSINLVNKILLAVAFFIALMTLAGFYIKVIIPLNKAVEGFNKVARGDFGHQVVIDTNNEISSLTSSFNFLSKRLNSIFKLIRRIQQGSDLDDTLGFIAEEFSSIIPINWASVLLHNGNNTILELQQAYIDGKVAAIPRTVYNIEGTLLQNAINSEKPLLISHIEAEAKANPQYVFLNLLFEKGMKSAIFLHLTESTQVPGMLIFASREENAYTAEHLDLLNNIAHLVTHSFGQTVRMSDQKRLAAIGEFTSGIVHEVRNPLTTINLALKYFNKLQLDEDGREWAEISGREAERMARLLEDVLLYAKPVKLALQSVNIEAYVLEFINTHKSSGQDKQLLFELKNLSNNTSRQLLKVDPDRLSQIFLNITRNAIEAATEGSVITFALSFQESAHTVTIAINNQGDVISAETMSRIGEPFFTTKTRGTGLGMGIVKRMTQAHGGHMAIASSEQEGTTVKLILPCLY